ncbi:MAG: hypothetical protein ACOVP1_10890 [Bacteroidia bacterium]
MFIVVAESDFTGYIVSSYHEEKVAESLFHYLESVLFGGFPVDLAEWMNAHIPDAICYQILGNKEYISLSRMSISNGFTSLYLIQLKEDLHPIDMFILERKYGNDNFDLEVFDEFQEKYGFFPETSSN